MSEETQTPVRKPSLRHIGPGIVVAATGVGAGDLASTLTAGSLFGYTLLWAAVIGCVVKIALAEGVGRWHLSTGHTIFHGWRSLGKWTSVYFGIYVVVWGFVYGAAAMSSTALPLYALFPDIGFNVWAVVSGLAGMVLVLFGGYQFFEKIIAVLVAVMFVTVVGTAVLTVPTLPNMLAGFNPVVPAEGGLFYTLGLIGGVGGTITMAAYGYWVYAKGWRDSSWMRVMRLDNTVAYVMTGIFVIAMLVVGAELLFSAGIVLEDEEGLRNLGNILAREYGEATRWLFLVGFWATSFTSILGVWNGVSLMFADFARNVTMRRAGGDPETLGPERASSTTSPWFRGYVLWLTFPPMLLLLLGEPIGLIIAYGALGALFMPFLAGTLLWLLNTDRTPREHRNGWLSNVVLSAACLLFIALGVNEILALV